MIKPSAFHNIILGTQVTICLGFLYLHYRLEITTGSFEKELKTAVTRSLELHSQLDSLENVVIDSVVQSKTVIVLPPPTVKTSPPVIKKDSIQRKDSTKDVIPPPPPPPIRAPKIESSLCQYEFNGTLKIDNASIVDQVKYTLQAVSVDKIPSRIQSAIYMIEFIREPGVAGKSQRVEFKELGSKIYPDSSFQCVFREIPSPDLNEFERQNPRLLSIVIRGRLFEEKMEGIVTWNQVSGRSITAKIIFILGRCN